MQPRTHHECVAGVGTVGLDLLECLQGAKQILGVEPAAHGHHGRANVLQVLPEVAGFPEIIIGPVLHDFVPKSDVAFEILGVGVRQGTHVQEELVAVGGAVIEFKVEFLGRLGSRPAEVRHEVEDMRQEQGAVVVPVIADKPIGDRRLGRGRLERRMGVNHARIGVESRVGNARHAHLAVVPRHVFDEPFDRVKSVRGLIHVLRAVLVWNVGPHVDVFPFGHPSPAHVLIDEDVPFLSEERGRAKIGLILVRPIRTDVIWGPGQHHRIAL